MAGSSIKVDASEWAEPFATAWWPYKPAPPTGCGRCTSASNALPASTWPSHNLNKSMCIPCLRTPVYYVSGLYIIQRLCKIRKWRGCLQGKRGSMARSVRAARSRKKTLLRVAPLKRGLRFAPTPRKAGPSASLRLRQWRVDMQDGMCGGGQGGVLLVQDRVGLCHRGGRNL